MSYDRELGPVPAPSGPRPIDPHLGPNRAARREQARTDRLKMKHMRKAVASIEHVLRRGGRP
jgi:hypothetical protein